MPYLPSDGRRSIALLIQTGGEDSHGKGVFTWNNKKQQVQVRSPLALSL
jgi:hypothetical protein